MPLATRRGRTATAFQPCPAGRAGRVALGHVRHRRRRRRAWRRLDHSPGPVRRRDDFTPLTVRGRDRRLIARRSGADIGRRRPALVGGRPRRNGRRNGSRSRGRCRRRLRGRRPRREEREGVAVPVGARRVTDPELDEWPRVLGGAARTGRRECGALGHLVPLADADAPQVRERDREAIGGQDRDGLSAGRHEPRKRHPAGGRGTHRLAVGRRNVDAAMLAGGVRVRPDLEAAQHGTVDRP